MSSRAFRGTAATAGSGRGEGAAGFGLPDTCCGTADAAGATGAAGRFGAPCGVNSGRRSRSSALNLAWCQTLSERQTYWSHTHLLHLLGVVTIIQTVAQDVAKVLQSSLDSIGDGFLLGLGCQSEPTQLRTFSKAAAFPRIFSACP